MWGVRGGVDDGMGIMAMVESEVEGGVEVDDVGASPTITGAVRDIVISVDKVFVSVEAGGGVEARMVAATAGGWGLDIFADLDYFVLDDGWMWMR